MASLFARFLGSAAAAAAALRAFPFSSSGSDDVANARKEAELAELRARQRIAEAEAAEAASRAAEAANRADKVKSETAEIISAKDTSEKAANDLLWARRALVGTVVLSGLFGGLFLAYDHYTHHNRAHLRRRIRQTLIAGPTKNLLPSAPPTAALPLAPVRMVGNRPTLLLGASGSGKSTQLGELARDFQMKGVPVVYFRFRSSREVATRQLAARGQDTPQSPQEGASEAPTLTVAAQRFYQAVGYPERQSYWNRWRMNGFKLSREGPELSVSPVVVKARFKNAITDLFAVCGELYHERNADTSIPVANHKPVVLSDELHDLLHDRYDSEGGKEVLAHFGDEMTHSGADERVSRVVLAASGADLLMHLQKYSTAKGNRVRAYMQPDPPESVVRERLVASGYDGASVDAIVAVCGTRVRLLYPFLESRVEDIAAELEDLLLQAEEYLKAVMARFDGKEGRKQLAQVLDRLAESPTSSEEVSAFPNVAVEPFPNQVLLRHVGGRASFQTEAVRQAWKRVRGKFV
jgi:hypothetical protein